MELQVSVSLAATRLAECSAQPGALAGQVPALLRGTLAPALLKWESLAVRADALSNAAVARQSQASEARAAADLQQTALTKELEQACAALRAFGQRCGKWAARHGAALATLYHSNFTLLRSELEVSPQSLACCCSCS
jgi:hypothetical protein